MATIGSGARERVFPIKKWYGLNENPDGDTKLKYGEASYMRNFKITRDGNLKVRGGQELLAGVCQTYSLSTSNEITIVREDKGESRLKMYPTATAGNGVVVLSGASVDVTKDNASSYVNYYWRSGKYDTWKLVECVEKGDAYQWKMKAVTAVSSSANKKVAGLWSGLVGGTEVLLAACDGKLYSIAEDGTRTTIGNVDTTYTVHMFGFNDKVYIQDGQKYREWDGANYTEPAGYVPVVLITTAPAGGGTELEQINKLNGKRRVWYSADGSSTLYKLPEKGLASIDKVINRTTGAEITTGVTKDTANGTVTITPAPAVGTNNIEISYTVSVTARSEVEAMRFAELFNGAQDNRVFVYGDGTNKVLYSGVDYDGKPRADYFPDMNVIDVGAANTPVTGLLRHFGWLVAFKTDSTYGITYGDITLEDGRVVPGFYVKPINRAIGNAAPGQVRLVNNHPRTLHGQDCYEWETSYNQTDDERITKRLSDRVCATLKTFDVPSCACWDDDYNQEYYIAYNGQAIVHNYAADAWYLYTAFDAVCFASAHGTLYYGTSDGEVRYLANAYSDCGEPIDAYWESGAMDFGEDYRRKYSSQIWVGLQPSGRSELGVTVQTDKKSVYTERVVERKLASFDDVDFSDWSFLTNTKPNMQRLKIKAKKFTYYKLIFKSLSAVTSATVVSVDLRVRYNGYVR